ncbi:MAG: MarR family transcriptional regulator [Deltaproteobacteria bacterium]|nr:MarR family transcriptional regulator [Deltaproteobacteria bacterium]
MQITVQAAVLLHFLAAARAGRAPAPRNIARRLHVEPAAVERALRVLAAKGLVDPVVVRLTLAGLCVAQALAGRVRGRRARAVRSAA